MNSYSSGGRWEGGCVYVLKYLSLSNKACPVFEIAKTT